MYVYTYMNLCMCLYVYMFWYFVYTFILFATLHYMHKMHTSIAAFACNYTPMRSEEIHTSTSSPSHRSRYTVYSDDA